MGTGKTVVAIALIAKTRDAAREYREKHPADMSVSSATLVMAPPTLVGQWTKEFSKWIKDEEINVVCVHKTKDLKNISVREIREADVVVASTGLR